MTSDRASRLRVLFEEALGGSPEQRAALLERVSAEDADLCRELHSLLEAHGAATGFLERPLFEEDELLAQSALHFDTPARVGAYRVVAELGRGGMGRVLLAERDDGTFDQTVAIKLLRPSLATRSFVERFERERQVLARLEHDYIARILDGGSTEDGLPFLVMERVHGVRLDEWATSDGADVADRLELFAKVCQAVQHAHQRLVVHGDLKPANILVATGPDGHFVPKLVDFGVAQVAGEESAGDVAAGAATPGYASPEQVRGEPLTTASDVYSLGVILYELVANARPSPSGVGSRDETPPPSRAAGAIRIRDWALRDDLDAIALAAIATSPDERYPTAEQLLVALELARGGHAPPDARRTSPYRMRRFVRRNRLRIAVVALVVLAASGVMIVLKGQRDVAIAKEREARRTTEFLARILSSVDPGNQGRNVDFQEVVDYAAESVEVEFRDVPEVLAALEAALGRTYHNLGMLPRARAHLERALELRRGLSSTPAADLASVLEFYGELLFDLDDLDGAEACFLESLPIRERLGEGAGLGVVLNDLGLLRWGQGRFDEAREHLLRSMPYRVEAFGAGSEEMVLSWNNLALTLAELDDEVGEEHAMGRAVESARAMNPPRPRTLVVALLNQGAMYRRRVELEKSRAVLEECRAIALEELGEEHSFTAQVSSGLGSTLYELGEWRNAGDLLREGVAAQTHALGGDAIHVAQARFRLGALYSGLATWEAARTELEAAYRGYAELGDDHPWALSVGLRLALAELSLGDAEAASARARRVLELEATPDPPDDALAGEAWFVLGCVAAASSDVGSAKADLGRALEHELPNTLRGQVLAELAGVQLASGDAKAAERSIRAALEEYGVSLPARHPRIARARTILARVLAHAGSLVEAGRLLSQAIEELGRSLPDEHPWLEDARAAREDLGRARG